jgi:hypothetical protein
MPTLSEAQQLLWRLITGPEGVAAALAADADRGGALEVALARTVRGDGTLDAPQRVDVYANMYFFRLLDVLRDDYPAVAAVLGDTDFHNLITDYLLHHPPTHFSIRHAGDRLPEFIGTHAVSTVRPYLDSLAQWEGALNDAFDAADGPTWTPADLAAIPASDWAALRFRLHPSVRLLRSAWAVQELRRSVDRGDVPQAPLPTPTWLCVWRHGLEVMHRSIDALEFDTLALAAAGVAFSDICAAADRTGEGETALRLAAALARWLDDGWIAGLDAGR